MLIKLEQLAEEYANKEIVDWRAESKSITYREWCNRDFKAGYSKAIENIDWNKIEEECEKLDFGYQTGSLITEFFKEQINKQLNGK